MSERWCVTANDETAGAGALGPDDAPVEPDGRSSRWNEHRARRREQLLDAAIAAVKVHGVEVGMDQIAATARTSKPVIYRYFADKGELYRAMGERIIGAIVRALQARVPSADGPFAVLRTGIDAYLELLEDNPELYRFVTESRALHEAKPGRPTVVEFSRPLADLLALMLGEQLRGSGLDPARAQPWGDAIVGFIQAASLWWIEHPDEMTRAELADYLSALLWGGIAGVLDRSVRLPPPG